MLSPLCPRQKQPKLAHRVSQPLLPAAARARGHRRVPQEFRDCSTAMPSSKAQPRRCHGQVIEGKALSGSIINSYPGAEQTPNCHKSTLSSISLQSSKAYSLLHVTKATGAQGQTWPGIPMQKPTNPKPCRVSQEIGFYSSSATQGQKLTNLRGSQTSEASNSSQG